MGVINVLSKQVAELIAAGEVIERPSSVIKELVENAIDAGAKNITVEIQNGGVTFMRVTDNGIGIEREDVRNAFLRHATSKILKEDDLDSIATLGFRGEALASICAVSRVDILTKNINEDEGTRYVIDGGEEQAFEPAGCPQGTTFVVRDLFYNVPARMKFLKKDVAESNNVASLMDRMALSHPDISFTFIRDGKPIMKTSGNGDLQTAIFQVFGRQFADGLIKAEYELNGVKMTGYVSKPVSANRASRNMQVFFVNGRYVKTKTAMAALEQAYSGCIMSGKFPACVMNIELDCANLDVNVHPAKLEIRFTNEKPIYDCVYYGVKSAIMSYDTRNVQSAEEFTPVSKPVYTKPSSVEVQVDLPQKEEENIFIPETSGFSAFFNEEKPKDIPVTAQIKQVNLAEEFGKTDFKVEEDESLDFFAHIQEQETIEPVVEETLKKPEKPIKYIGEAFRTYIIIEYDEDRIMFIDKHAAHERLIYEQLKKNDSSTAPQMLLEPITVTLDKEEYSTVLENKDMLIQAGFDVDDFGNGRIIIRSVPLLLEKLDITEAFMEISEYLQRHKKVILSEKMEWIYQNTACRAAIKAGNVNSEEELINLVLELERNPEVRYCPHGRPIYFFMSRHDIEKNFKRI